MDAFTVADDSSLIKLIRKAQRRLVFMAPAVSQPVAEALIERLNELEPEAVAITLDVDAETFRLAACRTSRIKKITNKPTNYSCKSV